MLNKLFTSMTQSLSKKRFLFMIIVILLYLIAGSFIDKHIGIRILLDIFLTFILMSGTYAISRQYHVSFIAALLALPMLVSIWSLHLVEIPLLNIIGYSFGISFFGYAIFHISSYVFRQQRVTLNVIYGAVLVYLLLGFIWTLIYALLDVIEPGSFKIGDSMIKDSRLNFVYFSFITLTTLGYGDITPLSAPAGVFSLLEAITGQIYLTVLVARLMGIHISQSMKE